MSKSSEVLRQEVKLVRLRRKLLKLKKKFSERVNVARKFLTRLHKAKRYNLKTVKDYIEMHERQQSSPHLAKILFQASAEKIGIEHIQDIESKARLGRTYVSGYQPYVAALGDVRIIGNSSLVYGQNAAVINDTLADLDFGHFVDMHNDTHVLSQQVGALTAMLPKKNRTVDRAIHLSGLFAGHFGHWYAEYLPRLRHFEKLDDFTSIPILVNSNMPASHMELLRYFCDNQIISIGDTDCVLVKELLVAPTITFCPPQFFPNHAVPYERQGSWSSEAMQFMRQKILAQFPQEMPQTRAIYLSRKNSSWGIVSNEGEVEKCLLEMGFEIVQPERHSFAEQVAILRNSHTIVGATGSALNSLMLAHIETDMLLLAQAETHNWGGWAGPMRDLGFNPQFLLSKSGSDMEKHLPITVDINRLRHVLAEILKKRTGT